MSQLISNPAPLRVITGNLNDMPDRLRLLAESIEDGRSPYTETVAILLLECADKLDVQLKHLRSHCFADIVRKECHD